MSPATNLTGSVYGVPRLLSAQRALVDRVLSRTGDLMRDGRVSGRALGVLSEQLQDLEVALQRQLQRIVAGGGSELAVTKLRLQLAEVRGILRVGYSRAATAARDALISVANDESVFAQSLLVPARATAAARALGAQGVAVQGIGTGIASGALLRQIVEGTPIQGKLLVDWFSTIASNEARAIERVIRGGLLRGASVDEITRTLFGARGGPPGVLAGMRRAQVSTLARTATQGVANAARLETFKANADVVTALEWVSTLDDATTEWCQARDRKLYDVQTLEPIGHSLEWGDGPGLFHWNCRSTSVPVVDGEPPGADAGRFARDLPGETVPVTTDFAAWRGLQAPVLAERRAAAAADRAVRAAVARRARRAARAEAAAQARAAREAERAAQRAAARAAAPAAPPVPAASAAQALAQRVALAAERDALRAAEKAAHTATQSAVRAASQVSRAVQSVDAATATLDEAVRREVAGRGLRRVAVDELPYDRAGAQASVDAAGQKAGHKVGLDYGFDASAFSEAIGLTPEEFILRMTGNSAVRISGEMTAHKFSSGIEVVLRGTIYDSKTGESLGSINRTFRGDKVEHAFFELKRSAQGADHAKRVLAEQMRLYQDIGIKTIQVHANIDVGSYCWAKYGFSPNNLEGWRDLLVHHIKPRLAQLQGRVSDDAIRAIEALIKNSKDPYDMWKLSDMTEIVQGSVDSRGEPITIGKYLLVNQHWYGSIPLGDTIEARRFWSYIYKRK